MDPVVQASLIAAVPAGIAAFASLRSAWKTGKTHKELQTGNGMPLGPTVAAIKERLAAVEVGVSNVESKVDQHRLDDDAHYLREHGGDHD